jgi:c-di-GMP-binding flagellar brake protein YcgR
MSSTTDRDKPADRRRAGRVRCTLTSCQFGEVLNISRTGMRVLSRKLVPTMPPGKSVQLAINAAGQTMVVAGRPVHNRPTPEGLFEVGFQFVDITEAQERELIDLARIAFDGVILYNRNVG